MDVVARHGDDEFVMLLPDTSAAGARLFAERILQQSGRAVLGEAGAPVAVPVTLGLATYPGDVVTDGDSLLQATAEHLQRARSDGRNGYRD